jgi:excisionase family DNA binding protein
MAEQDRLESIEETSRRLAVSSFTVRRLVKAGQVRAVRVGKRLLIPGSEIERIIASGCGKHAGAQMHAEA